MSFIDLPMDIEEVTEPKAGPEGDYQVVVRDVQEKTNESGELKGLLVICDILSAPAGVDPDQVASVLHNISLPLSGDDQEKVKNKILFLKRFMVVFNIPMAGTKIEPAAFIGKQAKVHLVQDEYQGTISNKIKLPNLR